MLELDDVVSDTELLEVEDELLDEELVLVVSVSEVEVVLEEDVVTDELEVELLELLVV